MDLLFVSDTILIVVGDVADPFLEQEICYYCPIFWLFNFAKPNRLNYKRKIQLYEKSHYLFLHEKFRINDWSQFKDDAIT